MSPPGGALAALRHRPFRIYITGQTVSLLGLWMQQVAQSWVIVKLAGSNAVFATVSLVMAIPTVGLMLAGGVLADRFDRRRVLIVTQIALAALAFTYCALVARGVEHMRMWHVYVLALAGGIIVSFDLPAQQALVPELVAPEDIPGAIAVNTSVFHGARSIGPSIGGILVAATSLPFAFLANGLSYFAVVASLMAIRTPARPMPAHGQSGWASFLSGLRYIRSQPTIAALIGFTGLTTIFVFAFLIIFMTPYVEQVLKGGTRELGLMMGGTGLGAMIGALLVLRIPAASRGKAILLAAAGASLALFAVSEAPNLASSIALVLVLAIVVALAMGLTNTTIQVTVPNELRGRVMSVYTMTFMGVLPLGGVALGALADHIGLRATLRVMACAYLILSVAWLARARIWRATKPPQPVREEPAA